MLQTQLKIGKPNDSLEQEAERVADHVMRMADPQRAGPLNPPADEAPHRVQRRCAECEEELKRQPIEDEEEELQTKRASGATPEIGPGLQAQISGLHGAGQPLSPALRAFFEPRFGHDFGAVRIHADRSAGDLAHRLRARAFTAGDRIFFAPSQFQPGRTSGRRLLAHELAHVLQQERLARAVVQRATHAGAADYHDPDNCWAFSDRQPTSQVIGRIEGILEVPDSCQGVIRMTSRFQVAGDWSLSSWLGSGSQLKFEINPIGSGWASLDPRSP